MSTFVVRFSVRQRVEHAITMVVFTVLCLTGLPQKFYGAAWAHHLIELFGGIDATRWIHRFCGWVLAITTFVHFSSALWAIAEKKIRLSMIPTRKDFDDAVDTLRYYLGLRDQAPRYDRFDYKQKFEYWGLVVGNVIMVLTGVILIYPAVVTRLLPGEFVPAAKVAHSNEGLMAFLVITIWHIYNAHLNPDVFPFDPTIFTGKISRERMAHEHPLELERLEGGAEPVEGAVGEHAERDMG
ncbi:MAG TPA: cytochrome b/b6 domain-containing protein [Anaeromyxobacteraceae bacterium]|nr:cytochrome b/b6 domain-containing protein [Anaeromyxobacteraceae bacterium]